MVSFGEFFEIGIRLISAGRQRSLGEVYLIKAIKYFFLVDVTFLFCLDDNGSRMIVTEQLVFSGIILLTYFLGKLQNSQSRMAMFQMIGRGMPKMPQVAQFNLRAEIILIVLSLLIFAGFWFKPEWASNPMSLWFHESILDIEDTPVFGFIFKIVGFFFLLGLINKMVSAFTFLLNGGRTNNQRRPPRNDDQDDYIDFEEVD